MVQCHQNRQLKLNEVSRRLASLRVPSASTKLRQEALGLGGGGIEGGTERLTPSTSALGGRVYVPPTGGALCFRRLITRILVSVHKQLMLSSCDTGVSVTDRKSMLQEGVDQTHLFWIWDSGCNLSVPNAWPWCRLCLESDFVFLCFFLFLFFFSGQDNVRKTDPLTSTGFL